MVNEAKIEVPVKKRSWFSPELVRWFPYSALTDLRVSIEPLWSTILIYFVSDWQGFLVTDILRVSGLVNQQNEILEVFLGPESPKGDILVVKAWSYFFWLRLLVPMLLEMRALCDGGELRTWASLISAWTKLVVLVGLNIAYGDTLAKIVEHLGRRPMFRVSKFLRAHQSGVDVLRFAVTLLVLWLEWTPLRMAWASHKPELLSTLRKI